MNLGWPYILVESHRSISSRTSAKCCSGSNNKTTFFELSVLSLGVQQRKGLETHKCQRVFVKIDDGVHTSRPCPILMLASRLNRCPLSRLALLKVSKIGWRLLDLDATKRLQIASSHLVDSSSAPFLVLSVCSGNADVGT